MLMRTDPFRELDRLTQRSSAPPPAGRDAHGRGPPGRQLLHLPGPPGSPGSIDLTVEQNVLTSAPSAPW